MNTLKTAARVMRKIIDRRDTLLKMNSLQGTLEQRLTMMAKDGRF